MLQVPGEYYAFAVLVVDPVICGPAVPPGQALSPCTPNRLRAMGHLFEAEDESQAWPDLHDAIREVHSIGLRVLTTGCPVSLDFKTSVG